MGASTTIAHAVFIIVSVIMASVLSLVVIGKMSYMQSVFSQVISEKASALSIRPIIVNAYLNTTDNTIRIFVKNTGSMAYSDFQGIDLYIGNFTGALDYYAYYNGTATQPAGTFTLSELQSADGSWDPGETVLLVAKPSGAYEQVVRIRIALSNGVVVEDVVSLG